MKVEVSVGPTHGADDPPPIAIRIGVGSRRIIRVELTPEDFALATTGALVFGTVTGGELKE